jgi:hypothetical protein
MRHMMRWGRRACNHVGTWLAADPGEGSDMDAWKSGRFTDERCGGR